MNPFRGSICLLITAILLLLNFASAQGNDEIKVPEPALNISFERNRMEIGDTIKVVVQISNKSAYSLSGLRLEMDAPASLKLIDSTKQAAYIALDSMPAYSVIKNNQIFIHAAAGPVGDLNIVFTLSFQWGGDKAMYTGQTILEKPIKIGFFGTDNVMGIPMAFAQFIVPGLAFLLVLRLLKIISSTRFETDEKIVVGVLISIICVLAVNGLARNIEWVRQLGIGNTISVRNIFSLALSGILLALITAGGWRAWEEYKEWRAKQTIFTGREGNAELILKSLKLNSSYNGTAWELICIDGTVYKGSHYFETPSEYVVIAAFQFTELSADQKKQLGKLYAGNNLAQNPKSISKAIEICGGQQKAKISVRNNVKETKGTDTEDKAQFQKVERGQFVSIRNVQDPLMKLLIIN